MAVEAWASQTHKNKLEVMTMIFRFINASNFEKVLHKLTIQHELDVITKRQAEIKEELDNV